MAQAAHTEMIIATARLPVRLAGAGRACGH
jgi:hypothetical protein